MNSRYDRRQCVKRLAIAGVSSSLFSGIVDCAFGQSDSTSTISTRPRIAFLGTVVRLHSHAQHFLDRLTIGYSWNGEWVKPVIDIASVYVDQFPDGDLARDHVEKRQLKLCKSVREALTDSSGKLAVDGVVIIAEHGKYPVNEKGQTRYPRYEWFKECVKVFEESKRSVPIFNDKHLSTNWEECVEMVEDSRRLGFAMMAGSSLPVTWRLPMIDLPLDTPLSESVCVAYGGVDSYDFHALETAQCMSERRRGGEKGIQSVHALRGKMLWAELSLDKYSTTRELIVAALNRSHNLPVKDGYPSDAVHFDWAVTNLEDAYGYVIEHIGGFRTTIVMTKIRDFNYAGFNSETGKIISCQMMLPMPGQSATTADFFNPLTRHIESLIVKKKSPYPIERTLLTSGMVIGGVESFASGAVYPTPTMNVQYDANPESTFWRE